MTGPRLVAVPIGQADAELLADQLWTAGTLGINELAGQLVAAFPDEATAAHAQALIAPTQSSLLPPSASEWDHDAWRKYATVVEVDGYVVRPPWLSAQPPSTGPIRPTELIIDPGDAFGSAAHPSTQQALALFSGLSRSDSTIPLRSVLDVGCGSGVLAIAAALRGATVTAIDNDPAAIRATMANAVANDVASLVTTIEADAATIELSPGSVDLVFVNVTIDIHERLAPVVMRLDPRHVIAAGILGTQLNRLRTAYADTMLATAVHDGEWTGVHLRSEADL